MCVNKPCVPPAGKASSSPTPRSPTTTCRPTRASTRARTPSCAVSLPACTFARCAVASLMRQPNPQALPPPSPSARSAARVPLQPPRARRPRGLQHHVPGLERHPPRQPEQRQPGPHGRPHAEGHRRPEPVQLQAHCRQCERPLAPVSRTRASAPSLRTQSDVRARVCSSCYPTRAGRDVHRDAHGLWLRHLPRRRLQRHAVPRGGQPVHRRGRAAAAVAGHVRQRQPSAVPALDAHQGRVCAAGAPLGPAAHGGAGQHHGGLPEPVRPQRACQQRLLHILCLCRPARAR